MKVRDAMTPTVEVADPNETIRDAARKMLVDDVGAIPVGANGKLVGMLTDRDIVTRTLVDDRTPDAVAVREVMSDGVVCCSGSDTLTRAAQVMAKYQVRRLPVIDRNENLVGILSLADLAEIDPAAALRAIQGVSRPTTRSRRID